jgi:hypothetical protein
MRQIIRCLLCFALLWSPVLEVLEAQGMVVRRKPVAAGGAGTWTLVQIKYFDSTGGGSGGSDCDSIGTACTVNASAVGAGHKVVAFAMYASPTSKTLASVTGETWTHCASCAGGGEGFLDAYYTLSATGGETSFTCTASGTLSGYNSCGVAEFAWSGASAAFDAGVVAVDTSCTACSGGGALTLTGSSDAILAIGMPANSLTAVSIYTPQLSFPSGAGIATLINTTNGADPVWTHDASGAVAVMRIALKGIS